MVWQGDGGAGLKPAGEKQDLLAAVSAPGFWLGAPTLDFVGRGTEFAVAVKKCPAPNSGTAYLEVFRGVLKVRLPSPNGDVMFLDSRAPAYVTVDARTSACTTATSNYRRRSSRGQLPKDSPVYTGNDGKRTGVKDIRPKVPDS